MAQIEEIKKLLAPPGLPELGPGPRVGVWPQKAISEALVGLVKDAPLPEDSPELIRALVLLWHDHIDAAHGIAQEIEDTDGSFVHGILHRREPDYGNAAYWFRRVGRHKCFPEIARRAGALLTAKNEKAIAKQLIRNGDWEAFAFIELCEKAAGKPASDAKVMLLRVLQGIETEVLLELLAETGRD